MGFLKISLILDMHITHAPCIDNNDLLNMYVKPSLYLNSYMQDMRSLNRPEKVSRKIIYIIIHLNGL